MPPAAASLTTFTPFARLPTELRLLIWREALPEEDDPALFFYKHGCWLTTAPSEEDAIPNTPELSLFFHHYLLDHVEVNIPMVFVNFEARGIALTWARQHGIQLYFCPDRRCYSLVRAFDPMRDAFYIADDRWLDFWKEPSDCMFQPDREGYSFDSSSDIRRIAFPDKIIEDFTGLLELLDWYMYLQEILIIIEPPPDLGKDGVRRQQRWEIHGNPERAFTWDADNSLFTWNIDSWAGDEALCGLIERASETLKSSSSPWPIPSGFKIQPVFAVRK